MLNSPLSDDLEYEIFKKLCRKGHYDFINKNDQFHYLQRFLDKGLDLEAKNNSLLLSNNIRPLEQEILEKSIDINNNLKILYSTNSTNEYLKDNLNYSIVLAEYQNKGKGRRGKRWYSPLGCNIYLSVKFEISSVKDYSFFPLYISTILAESLTQYINKPTSIKWPNDIYIENKKNSGSLLEQILVNKNKYLILGVGINVNMNNGYTKKVGQPYISLNYDDLNTVIDRNELLTYLLPSIYNAETNFDNDNIQCYIDKYNSYNSLKNRKINVVDNKNSYIAEYIGLNNDGSIKVKYHGIYKNIYSADVSVRL